MFKILLYNISDKINHRRFEISYSLQTSFNGMRNLSILRKKVIQGNDAVFKIKKIICSNKKIYIVLNPNKCQIYSIAIFRVATYIIRVKAEVVNFTFVSHVENN